MNKRLIEQLNQIPMPEIFSRYHIDWQEGRNWRCPFPAHGATGKTPSGRYYPLSNSYGCFGCHKGGGPIHFVKNMEECSFMEAVQKLMEWYHVEDLPSFDYQKYADRLNSKNKEYADAVRVNAFVEALKHDLTSEQEFNLWYLFQGLYLLDTSQFIKATVGALTTPRDEFVTTLDDDIRQITKENLEMLSEITPSNFHRIRQFNPEGLFSGNLPDPQVKRWQHLKGRYVFPIFLPQHILPGFSGRAYDEHIIKYWTTFDFGLEKKDVMYGLDLAIPAIKQQGYVILVEGILDVLRCRSLGFYNTVAPLSTYLAETHYAILSAYTDKFLLAFDNDQGGDAATERTTKVLDGHRKEYERAVLPEGEDPDSIGLKSPATLQWALQNKWR